MPVIQAIVVDWNALDIAFDTFCLVQSCVEGRKFPNERQLRQRNSFPSSQLALPHERFSGRLDARRGSSNQQIADTIISELAQRGVSVCSLLVVPDYHHQGLFTRNRPICVVAARLGSGRS